MTPKITIGDSYLPLVEDLHQGRFLLIEGRRGTGKTRAILTAVVARARRYPGSTWLLARSTRTRLSGTVLKTLYKQVLPLFGIPTPSASAEQVTVIPVGYGSTLVPMGMDDLQRGQSAEFSGGYVAEAVEIDNEDDVTSLSGAMREASGVPYHQVLVDCNPGAPAHWLNRIAEPCDDSYRLINSKRDYLRTVRRNREPAAEGYWKRIITHTADNPYYFDAACWEYTDAGREYMQGLAGDLSGHLRERWVNGLWVAAEGGVYPEFNESVHVIPPFTVPQDWPVYVGYDPGYDHPCAVLWFAISPNGTTYIVDEVYGSQIPIATERDSAGRIVKQGVVDLIRAKCQGRNVRGYYGDPQKIFSKTQEASGKSIQAQFKELGISLFGWPRSSNPEAMVENVRHALIDRTLYVFPQCRWTVFEFQSWRYKRNAKGEMLAGDDQYEDRNNDAMDCVRGMMSQELPSEPQPGIVIPEREAQGAGRVVIPGRGR